MLIIGSIFLNSNFVLIITWTYMLPPFDNIWNCMKTLHEVTRLVKNKHRRLYFGDLLNF